MYNNSTTMYIDHPWVESLKSVDAPVANPDGLLPQRVRTMDDLVAEELKQVRIAWRDDNALRC